MEVDKKRARLMHANHAFKHVLSDDFVGNLLATIVIKIRRHPVLFLARSHDARCGVFDSHPL